MRDAFFLGAERGLLVIALTLSLPAFGLDRSGKSPPVSLPEKTGGAAAVADGPVGDPSQSEKKKASVRSRSLEKRPPQREEPTVSGGEIGRSSTDSGSSAR